MDSAFDLFIIIFNVIFFGAFFFIIMGIIKTFKNAQRTQRRVDDVFQQTLNKFSVNTVKKEGDKNSHASQMSYSQYYSEKPIKDSGVKDGPLSEAEKNVLHGK